MAVKIKLKRLGKIRSPHYRIIVADSRQIYRGFDVGTAKPDAAEQAAVPHRPAVVGRCRDPWQSDRIATPGNPEATRCSLHYAAT